MPGARRPPCPAAVGRKLARRVPRNARVAHSLSYARDSRRSRPSVRHLPSSNRSRAATVTPCPIPSLDMAYSLRCREEVWTIGLLRKKTRFCSLFAQWPKRASIRGGCGPSTAGTRTSGAANHPFHRGFSIELQQAFASNRTRSARVSVARRLGDARLQSLRQVAERVPSYVPGTARATACRRFLGSLCAVPCFRR